MKPKNSKNNERAIVMLAAAILLMVVVISVSNNSNSNNSSHIANSDSKNIYDEKHDSMDKWYYDEESDGKVKKKLTSIYEDRNDINMVEYMNIYGDVYAKNSTVIDKNDQEHSLLDIAAERGGIFIEFMAPWCQACEGAVEDIELISKETGKDVIPIGVAVNNYDEFDEFIEKTGANIEHFRTKSMKDVEVYGVQFIPLMFYIDQNKVIRGVFNPGEDIELIKDFINAVDGE